MQKKMYNLEKRNLASSKLRREKKNKQNVQHMFFLDPARHTHIQRYSADIQK